MKKNYYTLEEVKDKFKEYRELKRSELTDDEYDLFCDELIVLPKDIVDRIYTEIYFVLLSADPKKGSPACYVPLKELIEEKKQGIIVLTPFIFASFKHESGKVIEPDSTDRPRILHEVAHHILGHDEYNDKKDHNEKEKDAEEQVDKWIKQFSITV
jgi:hypothetical protein